MGCGGSAPVAQDKYAAADATAPAADEIAACGADGDLSKAARKRPDAGAPAHAPAAAEEAAAAEEEEAARERAAAEEAARVAEEWRAAEAARLVEERRAAAAARAAQIAAAAAEAAAPRQVAEADAKAMARAGPAASLLPPSGVEYEWSVETTRGWDAAGNETSVLSFTVHPADGPPYAAGCVQCVKPSPLGDAAATDDAIAAARRAGPRNEAALRFALRAAGSALSGARPGAGASRVGDGGCFALADAARHDGGRF
jgi:fused signal recognition particle receptor